MAVFHNKFWRILDSWKTNMHHNFEYILKCIFPPLLCCVSSRSSIPFAESVVYISTKTFMLSLPWRHYCGGWTRYLGILLLIVTTTITAFPVQTQHAHRLPFPQQPCKAAFAFTLQGRNWCSQRLNNWLISSTAPWCQGLYSFLFGHITYF